MLGLSVLLLAMLLPSTLGDEEVNDDAEWVNRLWSGSINNYPNTAEAEELLDKFMTGCSELIRKEEIGESLEHRKIFAYVLTKKDTNVVEKPRLMVTSLMHSREPGGLAVSLYTIGKLCEDYQRGSDPRTVYLLDTREIWVVPIVNPDGYKFVEDPKMRDARKNRRETCPQDPVSSGVDLNRNFDYKWTGQYAKCSEEYAGEKPFSEPETQALKRMVEEREFKIALNFHSYGTMLTYPYNYAITGEAPLPADDEAVFEELAEVFGFKRHGAAHKLLRYTATGESDDWFYGARGIISMSPEVGSESGGFYSPAEEIPGIVHRNYRRIRHALHKAGLELRRVTCSAGVAAGRMKLSLKNGGLGAGFGKYAAVAVRGCGPSPVTGKIAQLGRRSDTDFEVSCPVESMTTGKDHEICIVEEIPSSVSPAICRCAVTRMGGEASRRAEWTTPLEDDICRAAVRSLTDDNTEILVSSGNENDNGSDSNNGMERWVVVAAVVVAIACLWLFIYTLWCAASQKLLMRRVAANNQSRYANLEIGAYDLENAVAQTGAEVDGE